MSKLLSLLALACCSVSVANGLSCYTCAGPRCNDRTMWQPEQCPYSSNICYQFQLNGQVTKRGCVNDRCSNAVGYRAEVQCYQCNTNWCNGDRLATGQFGWGGGGTGGGGSQGNYPSGGGSSGGGSMGGGSSGGGSRGVGRAAGTRQLTNDYSSWQWKNSGSSSSGGGSNYNGASGGGSNNWGTGGGSNRNGYNNGYDDPNQRTGGASNDNSDWNADPNKQTSGCSSEWGCTGGSHTFRAGLTFTLLSAAAAMLFSCK